MDLGTMTVVVALMVEKFFRASPSGCRREEGEEREAGG